VEETVIANNNKPRSSTDIGIGPWRTASYLNPSFTVEKACEENSKETVTNGEASITGHLHIGSVKDHINSTKFNHGD
ncbi:hypothetical protein OSTOST_20291, partial [Ostertagia ostertagi]